jgi:hypothetical protein
MVNVEPFGITLNARLIFLNLKNERSIKTGTVAIVTIRGTIFVISLRVTPGIERA